MSALIDTLAAVLARGPMALAVLGGTLVAVAPIGAWITTGDWLPFAIVYGGFALVGSFVWADERRSKGKS